jgi:hypothetical protein
MHCIKFYYYSFHSTPTCFFVSSVIVRGVYQRSMCYIHCCIPLQWRGTTHLIVRNIALFSGVALCIKWLKHCT